MLDSFYHFAHMNFIWHNCAGGRWRKMHHLAKYQTDRLIAGCWAGYKNTRRCAESTWETGVALEIHKEWMIFFYRWSGSMARYYCFCWFCWLFKIPHRGHQQFEVALDTEERSCRLFFDVFGAKAS